MPTVKRIILSNISGFTLPEMLVSVGIGSIIIAGTMSNILNDYKNLQEFDAKTNYTVAVMDIAKALGDPEACSTTFTSRDNDAIVYPTVTALPGGATLVGPDPGGDPHKPLRIEAIWNSSKSKSGVFEGATIGHGFKVNRMVISKVTDVADSPDQEFDWKYIELTLESQVLGKTVTEIFPLTVKTDGSNKIVGCVAEADPEPFFVEGCHIMAGYFNKTFKTCEMLRLQSFVNMTQNACEATGGVFHSVGNVCTFSATQASCDAAVGGGNFIADSEICWTTNVADEDECTQSYGGTFTTGANTCIATSADRNFNNYVYHLRQTVANTQALISNMSGAVSELECELCYRALVAGTTHHPTADYGTICTTPPLDQCNIGLLFNSIYTETDCTGDGGFVVDIGGGNKICRFNGAVCPNPSTNNNNWTQYRNWSTTVSTTVAGQYCSAAPPVTTGSHAWNDKPRETKVRPRYVFGPNAGACGTDAKGQALSCCYLSSPNINPPAQAKVTQVGCI